MTPKRRLLAVVGLAAVFICLTSAAVVAWRVRTVLRQSSAELESQEYFAVDVRPVNLSSDTRFDWFAAPAVFTGGAIFGGRLYLCGPSGLYEYSGTGSLLRIYRVGEQLPPAPLVSIATGILSDAHQPELLIATSGAGILAFDGAHFRQIAARSAEHPGALDPDANTITTLLPLSSGRLLIGTAKRGVLVYDGKRIGYFHSTLKNLYITALSGSEAGVWVGTLNQGLFHWQGGETVEIGQAQGLPDPHINSISLIGDAAYAATPVGVAEIAEGRVQRVLARGIFAQAVFSDGKSLAVGSLEQGLFDLPLSESPAGLQLRIGVAGSGFPAAMDGGNISPIEQIFSSSGSLYAVAQDGLYQRDAETGWRKVISPSPSMLADRNISALAVDEEGHLWVGYFDRGLDIVSPGFGRASHIENDHIYCINRIVPDPALHTVEVATANGLAAFDADGKERQVLGQEAGLISQHVTDVALYRGGLAIATPAGLTFMDATGAHSIYAFQGLVNNHVYALGIRDGRLLAGTLGGLSVLDDDNVTLNLTTATSGLKHNWITAVAPGNDGWFVGTYGAGVERLSAGNRFETTDATRAGVEINPNAMLVTPGHVLAGTLGDGLLVYNRQSQRWQTITAGLPSLNVTAFAASGGTIYIGTDNGLVKLPEERLDE